MKKLSLLLLTLFAAGITQAQTLDSAAIKFTKELEDGKMIFHMPEGFVQTPIVKNMQMHYELAVKSGEPDERKHEGRWPFLRA